jgi:hypothetical protein
MGTFLNIFIFIGVLIQGTIKIYFQDKQEKILFYYKM